MNVTGPNKANSSFIVTSCDASLTIMSELDNIGRTRWYFYHPVQYTLKKGKRRKAKIRHRDRQIITMLARKALNQPARIITQMVSVSEQETSALNAVCTRVEHLEDPLSASGLTLETVVAQTLTAGEEAADVTATVANALAGLKESADYSSSGTGGQFAPAVYGKTPPSQLGTLDTNPFMDRLRSQSLVTPEQWERLLNALTEEERRTAALLLARVHLVEIDSLESRCILTNESRLPDVIQIPKNACMGKKARIITLVPTTSVLLASAMPSGGKLTSVSAAVVLARIRKEATELGVILPHNCFHHMAESYLRGLTGVGMTQGSPRKYRLLGVRVSFEECARFWSVLPKDIPHHLRQYVLDWVNTFRRRGHPADHAE